VSVHAVLNSFIRLSDAVEIREDGEACMQMVRTKVNDATVC